jgi:uncharacterized beta-barrel protein YwiB (DUF1934 family)
MKEKVRFSLEGRHFRDTHWETSESFGEGIYSERGSEASLRYRETAEGVTTTTVLRWEGSTLEVVRSGAVSSTLVYELGKRRVSPYTTPFGTFDIVTDTSFLQINRTPEGILLELSYKIAYNEEETPQDATLKVKIERIPT